MDSYREDQGITTPVPPIVDTETEIADLRAQVAMQQHTISHLNDQLGEVNIMLEVANERWVEQVNKNTALEVKVRRAMQPSN